MSERPKYELYAEAVGDVKAMHLLQASVIEGQTPFEELSKSLGQLSSPHFPIEEWWKSFDRLKNAGLIQVRDINIGVIIIPSETGRELIAHRKRLAKEGRTLTGIF